MIEKMNTNRKNIHDLFVFFALDDGDSSEKGERG